MAYEYGYMSGYNPYPTAVAPAGYNVTPPVPQRPYTSIYGATSGIPQNTGIQAPQLPTQQTQQSNVPWIQVPNIEAARNVMVQPNQTAYMMNQNAPEFYVKNTDAMGVATLRCFHFSEFDPTQEAAKEVLSSQANNLVSREEFNNFAATIWSQINQIQSNGANNSTQISSSISTEAKPKKNTQAENQKDEKNKV